MNKNFNPEPWERSYRASGMNQLEAERCGPGFALRSARVHPVIENEAFLSFGSYHGRRSGEIVVRRTVEPGFEATLRIFLYYDREDHGNEFVIRAVGVSPPAAVHCVVSRMFDVASQFLFIGEAIVSKDPFVTGERTGEPLGNGHPFTGPFFDTLEAIREKGASNV